MAQRLPDEVPTPRDQLLHLQHAAVRTFGALSRAGEHFDPEEIWVWGGTHGFRAKDTDRLKEYARRAIEGGQTRTVSGHAIRIDSAQADRMVEYWRSELHKRRDRR